ELARGSFTGANIRQHLVAVCDKVLRLLIDGRIVNELADCPLLFFYRGDNVLNAVDGCVRLVVQLVGRDELAERALPSLNLRRYGVQPCRGVVQMVVKRGVRNQLADGALTLLNFLNDLANVLGKRPEVLY